MNVQKTFTCPICSKSFPENTINNHANACLGVTEAGDKSAVTRKRKSSELATGKSGWGFLMDGKDCVEKAAKKSRASHSPHLSASEKKPLPIITIDDSEDTEHSKSDETSTDSNNKCPTPSNGKSRPVPIGIPSLASESKVVENLTRDCITDLDLSVPLAELMRPLNLEDFVGQDRAIGKNKMLAKLLQSDTVPSMILWGPPGCGKTTLAKIIAGKCKGKEKYKFVKLSACNSGVKDVKEVIKNAKNDFKMFRKRTVMFLDEIHRFNKLQQDSMLPHVEDGTLTLIGATTENPSFQVNNALLSRCRVIVLEKLDTDAVQRILIRATERLGFEIIEEESGESAKVIEKSALEFLSNICDGDARVALNGLQMAVQSQMAKSNQLEGSLVRISVDDIKEGLQRSHVAYDRTGDEHYNMISALHKSMRGGDASAALYWMARMMEGGEEPLFIARRLIEFASDDIGLADPQALILAVSTFQAVQFIGRPECEKPLAQCVVYLSRAPKSYEVQMAYGKAKASIYDTSGPLPSVPLHLRRASTKLMKNLGYGKGYTYDPNAKQNYFPDSMIGTDFFK